MRQTGRAKSYIAVHGRRVHRSGRVSGREGPTKLSCLVSPFRHTFSLFFSKRAQQLLYAYAQHASYLCCCCYCCCVQVDALVRRGRVKVDGAVVKSPKIKLPVDCVIEVNSTYKYLHTYEATTASVVMMLMAPNLGQVGGWL